MVRAARFLVLLIAAAPLCAQTGTDAPGQGLSLAALPALVLGHDTTAAIAAQTTLFALHSYQGTIAQAFPQIDLTTSYTLGYTPDIKSQTTTLTPAPPFVQTSDVDILDQANHLLSAKLSVSQLLPTAGNLFLSLENALSAGTLGDQSTGVTSTNPTYTQKPRITLGLTQPLFVNGKLMDFELFPATLRKAQLGYLEQDAAGMAQRNQTLGLAVQSYLSIVQLRKAAAQTGKSIEVTQGNLDVLQKSFSLGSVAEADLLDAQIALSRQEQGLLELSSSLARAERSLAHSIGRDTLDGVMLVEDVPLLPLTQSRQEVIDKALTAHPLLRQKSLSSEEKRIDQVLSGQEFASSLTLSFSWSPRYPYDPNNTPYRATDFGASFGDLFKDGSGQDYSLSAGLTIHLFDGGRQREANAGGAALSAIADQGLQAQRQAILDQVELDLLQKESLEKKLQLQQEAARLAQRRLDTEKSLLALGKSTSLDVDARAADAETKANDLWRTQADLYLTVLDLHALAGDDLQTVIEHALPGAGEGSN